MKFVHLHGHSIYSVLDGLAKIDDLVDKAYQDGMPALAITDHASITALPEFYKKAKEKGIKPIIGCEFYIVDNKEEQPKKEKRYHLVVLAKNWNGVKSLNKQLTLANQYWHKRPRLDFKDIFNFEDCIISTACSSGILAHKDYELLVKQLKDKYQDDFYLELMPFQIFYAEEDDTEDNVDRQKLINDRALELAKKYGIKCIVTNDYHYVNKEDSVTHEVLLAIQRRTTWDDPKRWKFDCDDVYFKTTQEMYESCKKVGFDDKLIKELFNNTLEIAEKCNVEMPKFEFNLPNPYDGDEDEIFMQKIKEGWERKIVGKVDDIDKYHQRLAYEVKVIKELGFVRYFLIVEDIIGYAKNHSILVGYGRGSAGGSIVAYLLDITEIDPIKYNLYFERFLNPSRVSMPDIDIDFEDSKRHLVFEYIEKKYGKDKTAKITTHTILHAKSAFRDVARVFGIKPFEIDVLSKLIDDDKSLEEAVRDNYTLRQFCEEHPEILKHALRLEGVIRAQGVHAAGIIVSDEPLIERCVIEYRKETGTSDGVFVVNWDKDTAEDNGLLKIDVLGLSSLSIVRYTLDLIEKMYGEKINIYELEPSDPKVFEEFKNGNTTGVFQFESSGMKQLLRNMNADDFNKITLATALYRPGSLDSGETQRYVNIVQDKDRPNYYNSPILEEILEESKSILVYQEQVMAICHRLAGFTLPEADKIRKIIGKKLGEDELLKYRQQFIDGCKSNKTLNEMQAREVFNKIVAFASYAFNKSHSVEYTMLSYVMMYLKVYYPLQYFTALLSAERDDKTKPYIREAKRLGIEVDLPDINYSSYTYTIANDKIIAPLTAIKGIGKKAAEYIITEREQNGLYKSYDDFINRVYKRVVNKRIQRILYEAGALRSVGKMIPNENERKEKYLELVKIFDELPTIYIQRKKIHKDIARQIYDAIPDKENAIKIYPTTSLSPSFLVITSPPELEGFKVDVNETTFKDAGVYGFRMMWYKSTSWFYEVARQYDFKPGYFYITSATKWAYKTKWKYDPSKYVYSPDTSLEALDEAKQFVDLEIKLVNPDIIICLNTYWAKILMDKKVQMSELAGTIEWSQKYQKPIAFCYSPQYCYYRGEADLMFKMFEQITLNSEKI